MGTTETLRIGLPSENKWLALPDEECEKLAAGGWQLVRELLPPMPGQTESDEAVIARLEFLKEIIREVGPVSFKEAIKRAIRISDYRSNVTIKKLRECAGLSVAPPKTPTAEAWELVTRVVRYHVVRDPVGGYALLPRLYIDLQQGFTVEPVPQISSAVEKAVGAIGGWLNLREAYLGGYWGQKFVQWREIYRP